MPLESSEVSSSSSSAIRNENGDENDQDIFYEAEADATVTPREEKDRPIPSITCNDRLESKDTHQKIRAASPVQSTISSSLCNYLRHYSGYWKGLIPALLLCSNPAIHYTFYDTLKSNIVGSSKQHLSMSQAFVLGLAAKFCATLITYPLIRAKVILMVSSSSSSETTSLWSTLLQSYRSRTLYQGCDWQLAHTLLKSALMMMVRERVTQTTRQFVVGRKNVVPRKQQ